MAADTYGYVPAPYHEGSSMHILLTGNTAFKIANFRAGLVRSLIADGHRLTVLAPPDSYVAALEEMGCTFVPLTMDRNGRSPLAELRLIADIARQVRRLQPDIVFSYTIKNNIYSGLACQILRIPFAPNVTGLGPAFSNPGPMVRLIRPLYKLAFRRAAKVFFQNVDDCDLFLKEGLIARERATVLPGSGVDLDRFAPAEMPGTDDGIRFLLVARLLWDKGVGVLVEAARRVRADHPEARFQILGPIDAASKTSVPEAQVRDWELEGCIEYLGTTDNVVPYIANAHCVVLPSYYREGTPRSLIEAGAVAKPIITTDMPGCRDTVLPGISGYIVEPQSVESLEDAIRAFLLLKQEERAAMGQAGRQLMEDRYDEGRIIKAYKALVSSVATSGLEPGLATGALLEGRDIRS